MIKAVDAIAPRLVLEKIVEAVKIAAKKVREKNNISIPEASGSPK